ncbi:chaperone NapD [Endozoicomonas sp. SCSIO W0465]|uniref:chaperone NapD n=1 Tax=Endozoicomonas sp. SCSIO W0465 TaxID=2918516 RepID=UPI0020751965|nr:chaperone NapD [Endozoicomonas sp. SCSIO W0465]USE34308.1 chaperone NapD [Endozoicomonas sp. SCSIO W0465]
MTQSAEICAISGVVVRALPGQLTDVTRQLEALPGVEVHACDPRGKLVVTVEELPGEKLMVDRLTEINAVAGVLSAALIYAHQE